MPRKRHIHFADVNYDGILSALRKDLHAVGYSSSSTRSDYRYGQRLLCRGPQSLIVELSRIKRCVDQGLVTGFIPDFQSLLSTHYLKEILSSVFTDEGSLRHNAHTCDIFYLRQFLAILSRLSFPIDPQVEAKTALSFHQRQLLLQDVEPNADEKDLADSLLHDLRFSKIFRHGPGAVNDGSIGLEKWSLLRNAQAPWEDSFREWPFFSEEKFSIGPILPPRLTFVPKDARGPRAICVESKELMFMQQGYMSDLYRHIESHPATRGLINFVDQDVNRTMSARADMATIDLADASDRVSAGFIDSLFPRHISHELATLRSRYYTYKGVSRPLHAFATMGSALCFPVESLAFWVVAQATTWARTRGQVYTYGDDVIVPVDAYPHVLRRFRQLGWVPNSMKCCRLTPFRESCGLDTYSGVDVSVVKPRQLFGLNTRHVDSILATNETVSELSDTFPSVSEYLQSLLPQDYRLPAYGGRLRWNRDLQRLERMEPIVFAHDVGCGDIPDELRFYASVQLGYRLGDHKSPRAGRRKMICWRSLASRD
jgi:hypothetical protein